MKRKLLFLTFALLVSGLTFGQTTCYPNNADYNTGSTDGSSFTQTSVIRTQSLNAERGWARFNTSAIPDADEITSVELNIYVSYDNWAYFRVMSIESDPLLGTANSVFTDCGNGTTYKTYSSNFPDPGWYTVDLGTTAATDLKNLLGSNWFAVGLYEYEGYGSYYLEYNGWNETNKPYIVVNHNVPPTCPAPTAQTETNITATTADLGWTESGTADTWHIEWKAGADFTPGTGADDGNATVTPTPSYSLSSLTDGTTYYWYVQADCGQDGSDWVGPNEFNTTPANDLCANAEVVTCGTSIDGTTNGATFDDVGTCGTSNTAPGVWYKLEVDGLFKDFTVSTNHPATNFDTKLSVFSGDCDNLVCVGGNDDIGGSPYNTKSEITVATDPFQPQTYYILVHGYSSNQGDFTLNVTCTEPYPVPLNNWAIYLGIFLITLTMVFVFYRRQA